MSNTFEDIFKKLNEQHIFTEKKEGLGTLDDPMILVWSGEKSKGYEEQGILGQYNYSTAMKLDKIPANLVKDVWKAGVGKRIKAGKVWIELSKWNEGIKEDTLNEIKGYKKGDWVNTTSGEVAKIERKIKSDAGGYIYNITWKSGPMSTRRDSISDDEIKSLKEEVIIEGKESDKIFKELSKILNKHGSDALDEATANWINTFDRTWNNVKKQQPLAYKFFETIIENMDYKFRKTIDESVLFESKKEFKDSYEATEHMTKITSMLNDPRLQDWSKETDRMGVKSGKYLKEAIKQYKAFMDEIYKADEL